jgi:putative endonuclease
MLRCKDGELYVGIAADVVERVERHNSGRACRYTKYRRPVKLVYVERCSGYADARRREKEVKGYSREKKLELANVP